MSGTILASATRILWRTIKSNGLDPAEIFSESGLEPDKINDPSARFPIESARLCWALAAERIADPCFGIYAGKNWLPTDLHAMGYAFLSSTTLKTGLYRIARYNEIVDQVITFEITEGDHQLELSYTNTRSDFPDIPAHEDARWSTVVAMCRTAKAGEFSPACIELTHDDLNCLDSYRDYFNCEIIFNQPKSRMLFNRDEVEVMLPAVNKELAYINEQALIDSINKLHENHLSNKVAHIIAESLSSGDITDDSVAQQLFMSARTLQRKLAAENTSFKKILRDVRKKLAEQYIRDNNISISDISYLLGFSEQSAFSRSFKRWFDKSPSAVRKEGLFA